MSKPSTDPVTQPCSSVGRVLMIFGGALAVAALWLPIADNFVPMRTQGGDAAWLAALVPAFAMPRTPLGVRVVRIIARLVLIAAGLAGIVVLALLSDYKVAVLLLLPGPLATVGLGVIGPRLSRLAILVSSLSILFCLVMAEDARIGLPILAVGSLLVLVGALLWYRKPLYDPSLSGNLPRAYAKEA